jgi:hypothetical protein
MRRPRSVMIEKGFRGRGCGGRSPRSPVVPYIPTVDPSRSLLSAYLLSYNPLGLCSRPIYGLLVTMRGRRLLMSEPPLCWGDLRSALWFTCFPAVVVLGCLAVARRLHACLFVRIRCRVASPIRRRWISETPNSKPSNPNPNPQTPSSNPKFSNPTNPDP